MTTKNFSTVDIKEQYFKNGQDNSRAITANATFSGTKHWSIIKCA